MAIIGLESNYYCAHTPIPVQVTPLMPSYNNMYVHLKVHNAFFSSNVRMYQLNGVYYVDLSPWIKQHMHELKDTRIYYRTGVVENINEQIALIDISFIELDPDEGAANNYYQDVQKTFVQCALYNQPFSNTPNKNIKLWKGYPYSWHFFPAMDQSLYTIVDSTSTPAVGDYIIEYVTEVCRGSYLKWLNEYGSYNYWFFPTGREEVREAENIYDVNRSVFDSDKSSNYDTVGFNAEDTFTLRDIIKKEYWHLFVSLVSSPEVYILKDGWIDAYLGGATQLTPDWWIKVRQVDFEYNRTLFRRSMTEVEIELEYPKPYTQKRI